MNRTNVVIAGVVVMMAMALAACGGAGGAGAGGPSPAGGESDAAAGACPQGEPDCIDTPELADDKPVEIDETGIEQLRRDAQFYLGASQDELSEQVRIGRIDDEQMMLTEDYRVGRITVELDDVNGDGTPVVTKATVELPDGPETFELKE